MSKNIATRGFLSSLLNDRSGNTLAIVAGSIFPIAAMIGGGVDVSRAYMAKTQLQSACDAGVLAGRRAMSASGEYNSSEQAKADLMFEANFDEGAVDAFDVTFDSDDNDQGQVTGTATATVPTVVMQLFKYEQVDLSVECMAELQLSNSDVMFVLDTTGSMGGSRIAGLRDAVRDFHETVANAVVDGETRIRYGFVPYSMSVNASEILTDGDMPEAYFREKTPYYTKEAVFRDRAGDITEDSTTTETTYDFNRRRDCRRWAENYGNNPVVEGGYPDDEITTTYDLREWNNRRDRCRRDVRTQVTTFDEDNPKWKFTKWEWNRSLVNTSNFRTRANVNIVDSFDPETARTNASGTYDMEYLASMQARGEASGFGTETSRWNGCIEERGTKPTETFVPLPDEMYDLDINLAPQDPEDDADTYWRPIWGDMVYEDGRQNSEYDGACPAPMKLFQEIDTSSTEVPAWLANYLDYQLVATGNTYHDVGMLWGGRLSSPNGIFASNVNEGDVRSVTRHLIFMTDGNMDAIGDRYSAYGIQEISHRVAPAGTNDWGELEAIHTQRFSLACEAVKAQGITIWVIAFGTSMTTALENCASGDRAYYSSDTSELRNTFKFIASQVADLRLGE